MPILAKFAIPLAVVALVAAMRWFNVKQSGEPYFPGVQDSQRQGKSGGGNALPDLLLGGKEPGLTEAAPEGFVTSDVGSESAETYYSPAAPASSDPFFTPGGPGAPSWLTPAIVAQGQANAATYPAGSQPGGWSYIPAGGITTPPRAPAPPTTTPAPGVARGGRVYAI